MSFSQRALKNIILKNIDDRVIVGLAARIYSGWLDRETRKDIEGQLTQSLLNKDYERPIPEKPVCITVGGKE